MTSCTFILDTYTDAIIKTILRIWRYSAFFYSSGNNMTLNVWEEVINILIIKLMDNKRYFH